MRLPALASLLVLLSSCTQTPYGHAHIVRFGTPVPEPAEAPAPPAAPVAPPQPAMPAPPAPAPLPTPLPQQAGDADKPQQQAIGTLSQRQPQPTAKPEPKPAAPVAQPQPAPTKTPPPAAAPIPTPLLQQAGDADKPKEQPAAALSQKQPQPTAKPEPKPAAKPEPKPATPVAQPQPAPTKTPPPAAATIPTPLPQQAGDADKPKEQPAAALSQKQPQPTAKPAETAKPAATSPGFFSQQQPQPVAPAPAPKPEVKKAKPLEDSHIPADHAAFTRMSYYPHTMKVWKDKALMNASGPRHIDVSLAKQRGTFVVNGQVAMDFPVCTGKRSTPTPRGSFRISEKDIHHRSNLYHCAMPYFMRLTGDGIGLHVGPMRRYPASHGCIRLTREACVPLYHRAPSGTRVTIH